MTFAYRRVLPWSLDQRDLIVEAPVGSTLECADTRMRQIDRVPGLVVQVRSDESAAEAS